MQDDNSRRRNQRVDSQNSLTLTPVMPELPATDRRAIQVISTDISAGGLRVRLPRFMPVKSRLKIEIRLSAPPRCAAAVGEVRWVRQVPGTELYEAGIEFDSASPDLLRMLREYVAAVSM